MVKGLVQARALLAFCLTVIEPFLNPGNPAHQSNPLDLAAPKLLKCACAPAHVRMLYMRAMHAATVAKGMRVVGTDDNHTEE